MDAVELALTAAVAVSKLMGSEGYGGSGSAAAGGGGVGVTVMEVEACESDRILTVVAPSIDGCNSLLGQKDEMRNVNMSESTFSYEMPDTELFRHTSQISCSHIEDAPEELKFGSRNSSPLSMPNLDGKQIQRKSGKVVRSSNGGSKRSRMAQTDGMSVSVAEVDDPKEKTQPAKQKNGLNGKRGDKRNGKVSIKSKYDYFSLKDGMVSFNSASTGSNFLGMYGLKSDAYDVTKHLDEPSVDGLLDGSYKGPSFAKDKGKKPANLNENILHSVRKACSILQLRKPLLTQNSTDINNSSNQNVSSCSVSYDASAASRNDDEGDICPMDLSPYEKVQDSFSKPQTLTNVLEFPFCQPKDILERLSPLPPKDLDSLLLDAVKPAVYSKNNLESRGKQITHRVGLSPFPWSHNSGGHCKSNADAIKLSVSRTTCQGRWVKIGNTATSQETRTGFLAGLESLSYDHNLVPLKGLKQSPSENEIAPSASVKFSCSELGSSSSATLSIASQLPPESGSSLKCEGDCGHSPRASAAAETLCYIATRSLKQELHGMTRWPKKPSEKAMKACKSKSNDKSREIFAVPKSVTITNDLMKKANEILPLKKPRLLVNEKRREIGHSTVRKESMNWSMPRSSRLSPSSKSFRDSFAETKRYNANVAKQSCLMQLPSSRMTDKTGNNHRSCGS